jgi:uncharacterized membrane protein YsdA (DUF1294 family)
MAVIESTTRFIIGILFGWAGASIMIHLLHPTNDFRKVSILMLTFVAELIIIDVIGKIQSWRNAK